MKRAGVIRDEHKKICQACLSRFLVLMPLDCKDSARAFPKREAREKPPVILGVSTIKNPYISVRVVF
jgi:hypothetical protein